MTKDSEFITIDIATHHGEDIYTEALEIYLEGCLVRTVTKSTRHSMRISTIFIPNVRIKKGPKKELVSFSSYGQSSKK